MRGPPPMSTHKCTHTSELWSCWLLPGFLICHPSLLQGDCCLGAAVSSVSLLPCVWLCVCVCVFFCGCVHVVRRLYVCVMRAIFMILLSYFCFCSRYTGCVAFCAEAEMCMCVSVFALVLLSLWGPIWVFDLEKVILSALQRTIWEISLGFRVKFRIGFRSRG